MCASTNRVHGPLCYSFRDPKLLSTLFIVIDPSVHERETSDLRSENLGTQTCSRSPDSIY